MKNSADHKPNSLIHEMRTMKFTIPEERNRQIHDNLEHAETDTQISFVKQPHWIRQFRTGAAALAGLCVLALAVIGILRVPVNFFPFNHGFSSGSPQAAVRTWLNKYDTHHISHVTNNVAASSGGYFVAVRDKSGYQILFADQSQGKWVVKFVGQQSKPQALPSISNVGSPLSSSFVMIGVPKNLDIHRVIVQVRVEFGKQKKVMPVSLTQVGDLNLWVQKYPKRVVQAAAKLAPLGAMAVMMPDSVKAYNKAGKVVWSRSWKS